MCILTPKMVDVSGSQLSPRPVLPPTCPALGPARQVTRQLARPHVNRPHPHRRNNGFGPDSGATVHNNPAPGYLTHRTEFTAAAVCSLKHMAAPPATDRRNPILPADQEVNSSPAHIDAICVDLLPSSKASSKASSQIHESTGMHTSPATVFVIDDEQNVRESLQELIKSMYVPVECYASAEHFLDCINPPRPGVVVLDIRMPGMGGIELQKRLATDACFLPVVIVTGHGNVETSVEAMRQGAFDFLQKPCDAQRIKNVITASLTKATELWKQWQAQQTVRSRYDSLSAREREVCDMLTQGLETRQIATALGISPSTVEKHRLKTFEKMCVNSVPLLMRETDKLAPKYA